MVEKIICGEPQRMKTNKLFNDLKIVDLSSVLAGPSVASFFAELGAQVLKIENPNHPDITRSWKLPQEPEEGEISAYFSSINYGKKYCQIDYQKNDGLVQLKRIVKEADLVLMNFKKGLQEKLNLSDDKLREANPKLIIGKINGFGADNDRVAYDLILQAETGFMSMNGTPESGPVKMPVALIDVLAAHHLKEGLLIELLRQSKNKDYKGFTVTVSLYDAAVSSLVNQASNFLMTGFIPQRIGSLHPNIAPYGELFETADHKTLTFAIGSNAHFEKLCVFLGLPTLLQDPAYQTVQSRVENREDLYHCLRPYVQHFKAKELLIEMQKRNIPCGEVKNLQAVFEESRAQQLIKEEPINGIPTKRVASVIFKRQKGYFKK